MKSRMNDPKHFEDILKTIYFITSADPDVGKELLLVNDEEYQRKLKVTITEKFIPNIKKDLEISPKNKFLSDWLENLQELTS